MTALDRLIRWWRTKVALAEITRPVNALDLGCGDGFALRQLASRGLLLRGVGIDPDATHLPSVPGVQWQEGAFPESRPEGRDFDLILMLAVFEHVPVAQQSAWVRACAEHLQPTGRVVATIPSRTVDRLLPVLRRLGLVHGIHLEQHHGLDPGSVPGLWEKQGFALRKRATFELGLNHLFVFGKCKP